MPPPKSMLSAVHVTAAPVPELFVWMFDPTAEMTLLFKPDAVRFTAPLFVTMSGKPTVKFPDVSLMLTVPVPAFVPLAVTPPASVFVTWTPFVVFAKVSVETAVSSEFASPIPVAAVSVAWPVALVRLTPCRRRHR